ncbi:MAG: class II aldolase/adducin family protein [Burkholderiaceae bacterium]
MQALESLDQMRPEGVSVAEWRLRLELAAVYRLTDFFGWTELIFNHITVRVPDSPDSAPHFLINPFGLHYAQVTAHNLVKVDTDGNIQGNSEYQINPAGYTIHSAIHAARHDAQCVMHTHTTAGMAVACKQEGLRYDNFYSVLLYGDVAYHDFEGITTDLDECGRLVNSLGDKNILILRNHGLLAAGDTVPKMLQNMWTLQRACEVQLASDGLNGPNVPVTPQVLAQAAARRDPQSRSGQLMFDGMLRRAGIHYEDLV